MGKKEDEEAAALAALASLETTVGIAEILEAAKKDEKSVAELLREIEEGEHG